MEAIIQKAGEYLETRIELMRLQTVSKSSDVVSHLLTQIVLIVILILFFLMVNIGLAMWLGDVMGKSYYGFFTVAAVDGIVGILFFLLRKSWLKEPINNLMVRKLLG
jgi:hypothetical protein